MKGDHGGRLLTVTARCDTGHEPAQDREWTVCMWNGLRGVRGFENLLTWGRHVVADFLAKLLFFLKRM